MAAETAIAKMKTRTAQQSTQTLCEVIVMLASMPRTPETNLTRAVVLDVLCERHPEADAAAERWADSNEILGSAGLDSAVAGAALAAIGA
jgi:hypothetical protein